MWGMVVELGHGGRSGAWWSKWGMVVEVGHGGRVVEHRTFGRGDRGSKSPAAVSNLGNFVHHTLPVSFGRDTKSRWTLPPGVYARRSKMSHTGCKCVTCRGFKEWWSLSLTHQFPARERHRAGLTMLLKEPSS